MLHCTDLDFFYDGVKRVNSVSLCVPACTTLALFGHNGSGKSTLLKMLGGSLPARSGSVSFMGEDALAKDGLLRTDLRHHFGILFQGTSSDEKLSLVDNLMLAGRLWGLSQSEALKRTQWALEAASLSDRAHEVVKKLSGGMRRRLELYRSFMHWPILVVLDEPTAGLDTEETAKSFAFLKRYKAETSASIILASHHAEELLFADEVAMMSNGEIIAYGTPNSMLGRLDYLRCSFILAEPDRHAIRDLELYDWVEEDHGSVSAKLKAVALDSFLQSPILRQAPFKSFSIDRPSLADVYRDLCGERRAP